MKKTFFFFFLPPFGSCCFCILRRLEFYDSICMGYLNIDGRYGIGIDASIWSIFRPKRLDFMRSICNGPVD